MSHRIELAGAALPVQLEYQPDVDSARIQMALLNVLDDPIDDGPPPGMSELGPGPFDYTPGYLKMLNGGPGGSGLASDNPYSATAPYMIEVEFNRRNVTGSCWAGATHGAALSYGARHFFAWAQNGVTDPGFIGYGAPLQGAAWKLFDFQTWEKLRVYRDHLDPGRITLVNVTAGGVYEGMRIGRSIVTGTYSCQTAWYAQLAVEPAAGVCETWFRNIKIYVGYSQADPVATLVDVDGLASGTWDMSTIAFNGTTAGLTFSYAYGAAPNPANWSAYLTLAQLQAEVDPVGRYWKLRVKFGSDGDTQRTLTEGEIDFVGAAGGGARHAVVSTKIPWSA